MWRNIEIVILQRKEFYSLQPEQIHLKMMLHQNICVEGRAIHKTYQLTFSPYLILKLTVGANRKVATCNVPAVV